MATKTFKIGESAKGGIIKVTTTDKNNKKTINISVIDMFGDAGEIYKYKEIISQHNYINCDALERRLNDFLHDITTSYYSGIVMKWIKEKTKLNFFWC